MVPSESVADAVKVNALRSLTVCSTISAITGAELVCVVGGTVFCELVSALLPPPPPQADRTNEIEVAINDVFIRLDESIVLSIIDVLITHLY